MFQTVLKEVVEASDGAIASLLMGVDGLALEHYAREDASFDIEKVGIELSVVIKQVVQASTMLEAGDTHEVAIVADGLTTLVRMVNAQYFVALSLLPGANMGKARFLLRTRVPEMVDELTF